MSYDPSRLFDKSGYIPLVDYLADIRGAKEHIRWRLPMGTGDRIQLFLLSLIAKFSWLRDSLYVLHQSDISPAYNVLVSYLRKRDFFDACGEINLHYQGYYFFYFEKKVPVGNEVWKVSGQGVARDKATALSRALGELVERNICGMRDERTSHIVSSPVALAKQGSILYPPRYHRFLAIQREKYPELEHDPEEQVPWLLGKNLITNERVYIPKQITSWFFGRRMYSKILLGSTTNGNAGYFTRVGATLRGLLEVVQRDAFLVHWLTMIPPSVVQRETLPEPAQKIIAEFASLGITLHILDTTAMHIPTICVVAINDRSTEPQVVISSASAETYERALMDALLEAMSLSGVYYMSELWEKGAPENPTPFTSEINKYTRQTYWKGAEKIKQFTWFISGAPVSFADISAYDLTTEHDDNVRLRACLEALKQMGKDYEPVVYFPKNALQKKIGFFVANVFIPKAFPFYLIEHYGTFDSDRLEEFALSKGVRRWTLNPMPHMFS